MKKKITLELDLSTIGGLAEASLKTHRGRYQPLARYVLNGFVETGISPTAALKLVSALTEAMSAAGELGSFGAELQKRWLSIIEQSGIRPDVFAKISSALSAEEKTDDVFTDIATPAAEAEEAT